MISRTTEVSSASICALSFSERTDQSSLASMSLDVGLGVSTKSLDHLPNAPAIRQPADSSASWVDNRDLDLSTTVLTNPFAT